MVEKLNFFKAIIPMEILSQFFFKFLMKFKKKRALLK